MLPSELVDLILDSVDAESLASCALVASPWVTRSRHWGFQTISVVRDHASDTVKPLLQLLASRHCTLRAAIRVVHIHHRPSYGTPVWSAGDILAQILRHVRPTRVILDCHFTQTSLPSTDTSSITHLHLALYGAFSVHSMLAYLASFPALQSISIQTHTWRNEVGRLHWDTAKSNVNAALLPRDLHILEVHDYSILAYFDSQNLQRRFTSLVLHDVPRHAPGPLDYYFSRPTAAAIESLTLDSPNPGGAGQVAIHRLRSLRHLRLLADAQASNSIILNLLQSLSPENILETITLVLYYTISFITPTSESISHFPLAPTTLLLQPAYTMSAPAPVAATLPSLASTYGAWLISFAFEAVLYGMGVLQTWDYFTLRGLRDTRYIWVSVLLVLFLESVQFVVFLCSTYFRFVERFGIIQTDLIWEDSLQLLAAYLGAFVVQLFFASRIYKLTQGVGNPFAKIGMLLIYLLAGASILAGIAQTTWTYVIRSYLKIDQTKAVTTVQAATSLACDLLITLFLFLFLNGQKGEIQSKDATRYFYLAWLLTDSILYHRTNNLMDRLINEAIRRGTLTALASGINLVLFLALPDTFWFFLGLAPSSKLYMNSMLAMLNKRAHLREEMSRGSGRRSKDYTSFPPSNSSRSRSTRGVGIEFKAGTTTIPGNQSEIELENVVDALPHKSIDIADEVARGLGVHVYVERNITVR
ncbi:hypothetical protein HMN09_00263200 [Mycena chlorophos]|uniref:DUF6534 domain-containing protein n=1 Tax=Mycena chlorophos TaxID=658473 RepID=A0A8H6TM65_MYCCL|nr:hypothetical protein HMN09_00263200 [Mycena chlorophos]